MRNGNASVVAGGFVTLIWSLEVFTALSELPENLKTSPRASG